MSNDAKKLLKKAGMALVPVSLLLTGCGGGGESGSTSSASEPVETTESRIISGGAVKGVVQGGVINAWRIDQDASGRYVQGHSVGATVRTDDSGRFRLPFKGKGQGWVMVELTADNDTRMVCDVVPSCDVEGLAEPVPFGESFALSSSFELTGAINLANQEEVFLTPLSHLAMTLANTEAEGLSGQSITRAYGEVESWFGLAAGDLRLAPPDLTQLDGQDASVGEVHLAVANAAFLSLVNRAEWSSISQVIDAAVTQVETQQSIDAGGSTSLSLESLVLEQAVLASDLQNTTSSSLAQQALAVTKQRAADLYETVLIADAETDTNTDTGTDTGTTTDTADSGDTTSGTTDSGDTTSDTTDSGETEVADSTDSGDTTNTGTTSEDPLANAAKLTWNAPLTREDGTSLSMGELDGYVILYGQNPEDLSQTVDISDASTMEHTVEQLSSGTWYFAIKARDLSGNESALSEVVSKTI